MSIDVPILMGCLSSEWNARRRMGCKHTFKLTMSRAKSIYGGRPVFPRDGSLPPHWAKLKTIGYLSNKAKKNDWGIARIDVDANQCLQSNPCKHSVSLHLDAAHSSAIVSCPFSTGDQILSLAIVLGATKFSNNGLQHFEVYRKKNPDAKLREKMDAWYAECVAPKQKKVAKADKSSKRKRSEKEPEKSSKREKEPESAKKV